MVELRDDLRLALDRVAFARALGLDEPDPWQADLLAGPTKRALLNCCRQSGKSTIAAVLALHRAMYVPASTILLLSRRLEQSQELYAKVHGFYRMLERPRVQADSETALRLKLANGSRIISLPGKDDASIRGYTADLLIVDEAARVPDAMYYAILPMLAVSGGDFLALSTPWGRRGWWHDLWHSDEPYKRVLIDVYDVPRIPEEHREEARRTMPARRFNEEYLCKFEESIDAVFAHDDIEAAFSNEELQPLFPIGGPTR